MASFPCSLQREIHFSYFQIQTAHHFQNGPFFKLATIAISKHNSCFSQLFYLATVNDFIIIYNVTTH